MSEINVITPFSVDGTRYLPLGPELRGIGGSEFKAGSSGSIPINNNNLEEEFLFGTSKYTEGWFDIENNCYREKIIFGLGSDERPTNSEHLKGKYIITYMEYDTQPNDYDATADENGAVTGHQKLTLDYHKRVANIGTKIYRLYYVENNGSMTFCGKKTVTQQIDSNTGKCIIKKVISTTDN